MKLAGESLTFVWLLYLLRNAKKNMITTNNQQDKEQSKSFFTVFMILMNSVIKQGGE